MSAGNKQNDALTSGHGGHPATENTGHDAGRRTPGRRKTARWAGKAVPAAAIAATLAAGAAAYGFTGTSHSDPGKLAAALSVPLRLSNVAHAGAAKADVGAAKVIIAGRLATIRAAAPHASASSSRSRSARQATSVATQAATVPATATPSATARPAQPAHAAAAAVTRAASPSASTAASFTCSAGSLLPANVTAIVNFLIGNGYSHNAAAGIAGNIYQESKGDPESVGMGGGGLIGFTPLPAGYVTGNPAADLRKQLAAILTYNQIWSSYIPALNAAATPADAASIYVTDFERAGIPAASTREASAAAVASACGL